MKESIEDLRNKKRKMYTKKRMNQERRKESKEEFRIKIRKRNRKE
jgi:hypothetical protein